MNELYAKRIKKRLESIGPAIESFDGLMPKQQTEVINLINDVLEKLSLIDYSGTNAVVSNLEKENEKLYNEINKLQEMVWNNYKLVYNNLIKEL